MRMADIEQYDSDLDSGSEYDSDDPTGGYGHRHDTFMATRAEAAVFNADASTSVQQKPGKISTPAEARTHSGDTSTDFFRKAAASAAAVAHVSDITMCVQCKKRKYLGLQ